MTRPFMLVAFAMLAQSLQHADAVEDKDGPAVQKALQAAIDRGDTEFSLPAGDIYFNSTIFSVVGASGMRISGAGPMQTTLWFSPGAGVKLDRCHNITFSGFAIDYDPLPYTMVTILAISNVTSNTAVYDLELAPRSPPLDRNCPSTTTNPVPPGQRCERYGINQLWAANGTALAGSDFGLWPGHSAAANAVQLAGPFVPLGGRRFRSTFGLQPVPARVGDVITQSGRDWFTYTIANSSAVVTEDMHIFSSSGFTMMELDGDCGHTYRRVVVAPKPGYMIASSADVFHSSDCMRGALIEDCRWETNLDDFVNAHSTVHILWLPAEGTLRAQLGPEERYLVQGQDQATSASPWNVTGFWYGTAHPMKNLRPDVDTLSCYNLTTNKPVGLQQRLLEWPVEVTDPEVLIAAKGLWQELNKPPTNGGLNPWGGVRIYRVNVGGVLKGSSESAAMCDLDRFNGAGLIVRNNVFAHSGHPQCGARIKSSHSVLENNQWIGNGFLNLEVGYLQSWLEGPTRISNVSFRNERIINCTAGPPPRTNIFGGLMEEGRCASVGCCPQNITYSPPLTPHPRPETASLRSADDSITIV